MHLFLLQVCSNFGGLTYAPAGAQPSLHFLIECLVLPLHDIHHGLANLRLGKEIIDPLFRYKKIYSKFLQLLLDSLHTVGQEFAHERFSLASQMQMLVQCPTSYTSGPVGFFTTAILPSMGTLLGAGLISVTGVMPRWGLWADWGLFGEGTEGVVIVYRVLPLFIA